MDVRDDDSFAGNHMVLKFIAMTSLFGLVCYKGWSSLMLRREEQQARRDGRLKEYRIEKTKRLQKSKVRNMLGLNRGLEVEGAEFM